jgi:hypothetical protein
MSMTAIAPARDLEADLAICEAATPGPWVQVLVDTVVQDFWAPDGSRKVIFTKSEPEDLQFAASAREGWPYAIRRAMEAEKKVAKLETELERLRNERDFWMRNEIALAEKVMRLEKDLEVSEAEVDKLRDEIQILREQLEQRCARM